MLYNGACRLIIEGRFPELAVKMELDEWDQLVGLGFGESNRIKEKAMMKKVREEWLESLQVGTVLNEFE